MGGVIRGQARAESALVCSCRSKGGKAAGPGGCGQACLDRSNKTCSPDLKINFVERCAPVPCRKLAYAVDLNSRLLHPFWFCLISGRAGGRARLSRTRVCAQEPPKQCWDGPEQYLDSADALWPCGYVSRFPAANTGLLANGTAPASPRGFLPRRELSLLRPSPGWRG